MLAVMTIIFFSVADVKCGLCEINKNNRANATHGLSPVQNMYQDRTEAMLDRGGSGPRPGPVLTLLHKRLSVLQCFCVELWNMSKHTCWTAQLSGQTGSHLLQQQLQLGRLQ